MEEGKPGDQGPGKKPAAGERDILAILEKVGEKVKEACQNIRDSRPNGIERGLEAALQEQARDMALTAIRTTPELRDALRALVEQSLNDMLLGEDGQEEEEEEEPGESPDPPPGGAKRF